MKIIHRLIAGIFLMLLTLACQIRVDVNQERENLLQTDREFARKSIEAGAAEAFNIYLTEDALQLPAGRNPRSGRENIYQSMKEAGDGYTLNWQPEDGEVSSSGDLAYTWGFYTLSWEDSAGTQTSHGKYLNVWKKLDGQWKVLVDMGNSNPAPESE